MRRRKMNKRKSKQYFTKTASRHHKKNNPRTMKRGGIRL